MHVHILGVCGTFMAGVAALARAAGHRVTGSDAGVYPPMSDQLADMGIDIIEGYAADQLDLNPDVVVVGNVMSRGVPVVEEMLNRRLDYVSGPGWLAREVLPRRRVVAVAGTHGKTTTTSLLAWILERAGLAPGFLIGGVPRDFGISARIGEGAPFVIEADEYDCAFFDKRAKFLHYRPEIQVITNLEYDHADIYPDLAAIEWQFHQLLRMLPGNGRLVVRGDDDNLRRVIERGCWTPVETFSSDGDADWIASADTPGVFRVARDGKALGQCNWRMTGAFNAENALAALLAARGLGVDPGDAMQAIADFGGVRRRLELRGTFADIRLYDDFAHHPTAIRRTIEGLRKEMDSGRLLVVLEPRSNTMRLGVHRDTLGESLRVADKVWVFGPSGLDWDVRGAMGGVPQAHVCDTVDAIVGEVARFAEAGDRVVVMSNGGFQGIHGLLAEALQADRVQAG